MTSTSTDKPASKLVSNSGNSGFLGRIRDFRLIPAIDRDPASIAFAQTRQGKLLLLCLFGVALLFQIHYLDAIVLTAILTATTFFPQHRRLLLTAGTLLVLLIWPSWFDWSAPQQVAETLGTAGRLNLQILLRIVVPVVLVFDVLLIICFRKFAQSPLFRRPVLLLGASYTASIVAVSYAPPSSKTVIAWAILATFGAYFWFLSYALVDQGRRDRDSLGLQVGTFHPFWGSTTTPLPKGAAYLRRVESKTKEDLAVTQLKALKLLFWSDLLALAQTAFTSISHEIIRIPTLGNALGHVVVHSPYPWYLCWLALLTAFAENLLSIAVWGHRFVACCRMAGFRALRNTYRPLAARTIADFWNRYYFYFKELLVEFFFYPTFFRYFKQRGRLRLAAATIVAAGFGNMFFHFIRDLGHIAELGLWRAVAGFHVYAFYCLVLSTGIAISQIRTASRPRPPQSPGSQIMAQFGVLLFFCLLQVFDDTGRTHPITVHLAFFLRLFGIGG